MVVIGGLGSIFGSVAAGFAIGLIQALGEAYLPALSQTLVFVLMAGCCCGARPACSAARRHA